MVCDVVADVACEFLRRPVQLEACTPLERRLRSESQVVRSQAEACTPSNKWPQLEAGLSKLAKS